MKIELDPKTIDAIAYKAGRIAAKLAVKMLKEQQEDVPEMVTTEEAARMLGITPGRMRQIKNRFPHTKSGECRQGKLLFKRDSILQAYTQG